MPFPSVIADVSAVSTSSTRGAPFMTGMPSAGWLAAFRASLMTPPSDQISVASAHTIKAWPLSFRFRLLSELDRLEKWKGWARTLKVQQVGVKLGEFQLQ